MPWYFFAFLGAAGATTSIVLQKKVLGHEKALQFAVCLALIGSIFSFLLIPYISLGFSLKSYLLVIGSAIITSSAFLFLLKALKSIEVSLTAPFYNLGLVFVAVLAYLFLGERLVTIQLAGVFFIVLGGYVVNVRHGNLLQPVKDLIKSKYIHYVLYSVFAYSGAYVLDKFVLGEVDFISLFFLKHNLVTLCFLFYTFAFYGGLRELKDGFHKGRFSIFLVSVLGLGESLAVFKALSIGEASLVLPVYRMWTLMAVVLGGEMFHDHNLKYRIFGCIIMLIGVWLTIK